jgi:hypothetical protein
MDPPKHPKQDEGALALSPLSFERRASSSPPLFRQPLSTSNSTFPRVSSLYQMAGPVRSSPTNTTQRVVQPPRPPNAWILYRSDMVRELPPVAPGTPRRAQAEVSKMISDMWKAAPERVRQHYEQLADAKKAEHQAMYPGYRFQPMKKEEKERLREEKRLEKEKDRAQSRRHRSRPTPYPVAGPATGMPHGVQFYQPDLYYGSDGPSPPLSAASSPNYGSPAPDSHYGSERYSSQQPPSPVLNRASTSAMPPPPLHIASPRPGVHASPPDASMWPPSPRSSGGTSTWNQYDSVHSRLNAPMTEVCVSWLNAQLRC